MVEGVEPSDTAEVSIARTKRPKTPVSEVDGVNSKPPYEVRNTYHGKLHGNCSLRL